MVGSPYCLEKYSLLFSSNHQQLLLLEDLMLKCWFMTFSNVCPLITFSVDMITSFLTWILLLNFTSLVVLTSAVFSFLSVIFLSFILLLAHLSSKAGQCFSNYSCFGKVGKLFYKAFLNFLLVVVTANLLSATLLCLCLMYVYSLAWEHATSKKCNTCHAYKKPHLIYLSFRFFLITCNLINSWSLIMLFEYDLMLYGEILSVIQYYTYGFCVWLICTAEVGTHVQQLHCHFISLMPRFQVFPLFIIDIFSWFLWLRSDKLPGFFCALKHYVRLFTLICRWISCPFEVGASFSQYFLSLLWLNTCWKTKCVFLSVVKIWFWFIFVVFFRW